MVIAICAVAQRFGVLARNHWRIGNAAENFSRVRRLAFMMLKRKKAAWDQPYLLKAWDSLRCDYPALSVVLTGTASRHLLACQMD